MTKIHKVSFGRKKRTRTKSLKFIYNPEDCKRLTDKRPARFAPHWVANIQPHHEHLILCKSATDTQALNANFSDIGILAVHMRDFLHVPSEIIGKYRERFGGEVFVLFSFGKSQDARKLAKVSGFKFLDYQSALNFCGVAPSWIDSFAGALGQLGDSVISDALGFALETAHSISSYSDDIFSIAVADCFKLEFSRYVGEASDELSYLLTQHDKLILQSGAGTGKSTWLIKLANSQLHLNVLNCKHLVIVEPKTSIAQQLFNDFKKGLSSEYSEGDCVMVSGGMDAEELRAMESAKIIIVVTDSLHRIAPIISECLLVVDEFHEIGQDQDYRPKPMFQLWECMKLAKRKLLLSATPNYILTTNWHKDFNYKLVVGVHDSPNTFKVIFKHHKCSKRQLFSYIEENAPAKKGTICIKYDHDTTLSAYLKYFFERFVSADYFTSKRKDRKENNLNYQSLMESGELSEELQYLLFTKLLESGVSFKFDMRLLCLFDSKSYQEIIQLATRARYNVEAGRNMENEIWVFVSEKKTPPAKSSDSVDKRFFDLLHSAQADAKKLDKLNSEGKKKYKVATDLKDLTREVPELCPVTQVITTKHVVDIPAILFNLYQQSRTDCCPELLKKRLIRFDSRFTCETEYIEVEKTEEISNLLSEVKASREEGEKAFLKLAQSDLASVVHATCYLSKNMDFKENTKRSLRLGLMPKERIRNFILKNPKAFAFDHKTKTTRELCALVEGGLTKSKALDAICSLSKSDLQTEVTARTLRKRHAHYKKAPENLSANDKYQCINDKAIFKRVDKVRKNAKAGKYKNGLSKSDICGLINRALVDANKTKSKALKPAKALAKLKGLYEVNQVRKMIEDKRVWRYEIGGRKFNLDRGK